MPAAPSVGPSSRDPRSPAADAVAAPPRRSTPARGPVTVLSLLLAVLLTASLMVVAAGPAEARRPSPQAQRAAHARVVAAERARVRAVKHSRAVKRARAHAAAVSRKRAHRVAVLRRKQAHRAAVLRKRQAVARARRARLLGIPQGRYAVPPNAYFSYPNRSAAESTVIRDRVLATVESTWGTRRNSLGLPLPRGGTIRMASWTFDDWPLARALVAAKRRGVSVQVLVAKDANDDHRSWHFLRRKLGSRPFLRGHPETRDVSSFARQCKGSCRGLGGTAHAKYFLFDDVGPKHVRSVVMQTSMNLTQFAYANQWNHAQVLWSPRIYGDYLSVFRQARLGRATAAPYHVYGAGNVVDFFFPRPQATPLEDPVMQTLANVSCTTSRAPGTAGRTRIRIAQYAIYGQRGTWIARRLRYLWNHGCNVAIIYSVSSRPALSILRSKSGRGPIPMRQSVVKDAYGTIVKYNHSKWMTITGTTGRNRKSYLTLAGSANWADLALGSDEQMQRISSQRTAATYEANFAKTWAQRSSHLPGYGHVFIGGRMLPEADVPEDAPEFGTGVFQYMTQD